MEYNDYYNDSIQPFFGVVEEVLTETFVRVRVFGVHPLDKTKVRTDQLPPFLVTYPTTGGQVGGGSISHNLEVDSWVYGMFTDYPVCMQGFVIAAINGASYSMSNYASGGGEFVGQGGGQNSSGGSGNGDGSDSGGGGGGSNENPSVDTNATTNIPGDFNVQKAYNYIYKKLMDEGTSGDLHMYTSAFIGVLLLETSGINPSTINSIGAYGICQWLRSRKAKLFEMYGQTKRLDQQLDFMWWEMDNEYRSAKGVWLASNNIPDAVAGGCLFERAEEVPNGRVLRNHRNFKLRLQHAYTTYNSMKYTGGGALPPVPEAVEANPTDGATPTTPTNSNTYEYTSGGLPIDPDSRFIMDSSDPRYADAIAKRDF